MNYGRSTPDKIADAVNAKGTQLANGIENAVDAAHDMAQDTLSNVSSKLDSARDTIKPKTDRLIARGEEIASNVMAGARDSGTRAKAAASRYASACESYVTEQPMRAVAIAAAAGATIAALLMLSRSRSARRNRLDGR